MAVLNVRVDDHIRDQLKAMADAEGVTLSEYVRDLLLHAVVPVYETEMKHGDERAPERHPDDRPTGALAAAPHSRAGAAGRRE